MATKPKTAKPSPKTKPATKAAKPKAAPAAAKLPPEEKVAADVLKLLHQATDALDKSLKTGASTTAKARKEAAKKAHTLLGRAHTFLGKSLDDSVATLKKAINKVS